MQTFLLKCTTVCCWAIMLGCRIQLWPLSLVKCFPSQVSKRWKGKFYIWNILFSLLISTFNNTMLYQEDHKICQGRMSFIYKMIFLVKKKKTNKSIVRNNNFLKTLILLLSLFFNKEYFFSVYCTNKMCRIGCALSWKGKIKTN